MKNYGTPGHYEDEAVEAEKNGEWKKAAEAWDNAAGATIGHNRRRRYQEYAEQARKKAGA